MEKVSLSNYREDNLSELKMTQIAQTIVIQTPYLNFNKHSFSTHTGSVTITVFISDHQNWFGIDENLGPVAVSIRRERVPSSPELVSSVTHAQV